MLTELYIRNFAIIDDLSIPFSKGFNVLTGETGAGKSIIIEALSIITGSRVSSDVIRSGEKAAEITAFFSDTNFPEGLISSLENAGFSVANEFYVKRTIYDSGKSRAFINDSPSTLSLLQKISPYLLEISSQHEHQQLLNENTHLEYIDRFANITDLLTRYRSEFFKFKKLIKDLHELEKIAASKTEERDFLSYQLNEIESADLKPDEEANLTEKRDIIKNAAKLFESAQGAYNLLSDSDTSIISLYSGVGEMIDCITKIDPKTTGWKHLWNEAEIAINELSMNLQKYMEELEIDPSEIDDIESRLYEIKRLKKKYGETVEDIFGKHDEIKDRLNLLDNSETEIKKTKNHISKSRDKLNELAVALSKRRKEAANFLSSEVEKEMRELGMKYVTFSTEHNITPLDFATERGIDNIRFVISTNAGEIMKPISKIASGGELSRVMLAIKRVFMKEIGEAQVEIFDEADSGIGGAIAEVVGKKLKDMSRTRQVISITHLPQVASWADHHIVVEKELKAKKTKTKFSVVKGKSRIEEIARMLSGTEITNTTRQNAVEMLKGSANG